MVKEYTSMLMEVNTMETGLIISEMVRANNPLLMETSMMVIGLEISSKGLVLIHMRMEINMMVNGSKDLGMERGLLHLIPKNTPDIGKMVIERGWVPSPIKKEINM